MLHEIILKWTYNLPLKPLFTTNSDNIINKFYSRKSEVISVFCFFAHTVVLR